ncbi:urea carboxylase-associated family protein [Paenibacillus sp. N3.4]|uniref:urea carboxylase-associated family protein n=1 Tax=Paenibacillus sp. N3.4 TaxID=2603222 RepID=UPI0021C2B3FA|nr:urea carboxylase-associated family protein [Paenibacillus sp. N3.4]
MTQQWLIPATEGLSLQLKKGEVVRITDVAGEQVADFVAYRADDFSERLDPSVTMDALHAMKVKPGDVIYSNKYKPMLTIVKDTVGTHDFINSACRPEMYEFLYNKRNHASCYMNLNNALAQFDIPAPDQHYPFNLFMNTVIKPSGQIRIEKPLSKAGDSIELRAEMDLIVAISACPCEESICNGYKCTPIAVELL